jgi:hypothetical protein
MQIRRLTRLKEERIMSHRLMFAATATLLLVTALHSADQPAEPPKLTADRVKLVRAMYEKLPGEILGFAEPSKKLSVLSTFSAIEKLAPGGTYKIEMLDAKDKKLTIRLDRKLQTKTRDSLFISTNDGDEVRLPPRGPEESAVYGLLLRLPKADKEMVEEVLKVLDERFAGRRRTWTS